MATYGNDSITGLAAGGLPDDSITNAELADDAVQAAQLADDAVVQAAIADEAVDEARLQISNCLLYTSPSPRDLSTSRMPSSA